MDQPSVQTVQTGAAASNPIPTSLFQCGTCKRSYTRLDHLARHVRSHTQEKPYTCHVCSKSFTRADLLKRHVAAHDSAPKGVKRQKRAHSPSRQGRVSQACEACAEVHLKCEEKKPCARCLKKNIPCRSSSNAYDNSNVSTADTVDCAANLLALASEEGDRQINSVAFLDAGPMEPTASMDNSSQDPLPFDMAAPASPFHSAPLPDHADLDADLRSLPGFLKSILPSFTDPSNQPTSLWSNGPDSGMWTPRAFVNDFGLDTNLELDDIDMSFLGTYNQEVPFDFDINSQPGGSSVGGKDASDPSRGIAIGSEAFKHTSIWRFRPVSKDTSTSELKNLSVPSVEEAVDSPESRIMIQNPMTIERLAPPTRDKVLALILSQCRPDHVQKTVSAFPSLELLDILLQYYLTCPRSLASNFIHLPTFNPQHRRPELIAAMIAAGAVTAPDKALNKLGYAIQEAVRLGLANSWESDNSGTRATELLQAYIIQLHIGLWSGNNRKMELAESFEQPLATMLRRAGKFRRSAYPATFPREEDCGTVLEARWKEWVDLETTKRLVFNLYRHDGTWSMAMSAGTVISAHELLLPLPEARELWNAPDANTWKNIYLSRYSETILTRRPSLVDCMNDLENLSLGYLPIDERYANLVFLTGVWSLVWEFRRSSSLQKSQSTMWGSNLVLSSRYQELVRLCQHYRMSSPAVLASDYRAAISLELILMHLHISLEDVQLFVGIEGQEEARNVYPLLREWVKTTSARQAIWHAGQVIKIAKSVPRNELGEWVAVGVYHASLVFWAYGLISDPSSTGPTKERANSLSMANTPDAFNLGTIVWLDGDETTEVQRFIALERGTPGIRGLERNASGIGIGPTTLDCPSKAMGLVIEILQNNFDKSIKTKPPLVENLVQLMSSLSVAAREVGS